MPNRILREGILGSDRVNRLSPYAELFYRRLMSKVDDFGLYDSRFGILRGRCYPLKIDDVTEPEIAAWLQECEGAGLIRIYAQNGLPETHWLSVIDIQNGLKVTPRAGPSFSSRSGSSKDEPIVNAPPGIRSITRLTPPPRSSE